MTRPPFIRNETGVSASTEGARQLLSGGDRELSAGEDDGLERQYVFENRTGAVAHLDGQYALDADRENVARQLRER
jgi:hypothetical protein